MHVAALADQTPVFGYPSSEEVQIGGPVGNLLGTAEDDHDRLVVGRDKGLRVLDGIEYRPARYRVVRLRAKSNTRQNTVLFTMCRWHWVMLRTVVLTLELHLPHSIVLALDYETLNHSHILQILGSQLQLVVSGNTYIVNHELL